MYLCNGDGKSIDLQIIGWLPCYHQSYSVHNKARFVIRQVFHRFTLACSAISIEPGEARCWIHNFFKLACSAELNCRICNYFPDITETKRFKVAQLGNVRVRSSGARHDIRIAAIYLCSVISLSTHTQCPLKLFKKYRPFNAEIGPVSDWGGVRD